ncbi:hypothetical protein CEXT_208451 [Caerostris extrusa]|uniref:Uncharacterized protein n=1 Tax=Caerostris extrusa TaxID=172846 RepID=A0AAV4XRB6_CAEEX|nr:hypothetical protein CEXT_208451 [Caerostris extrusa]
MCRQLVTANKELKILDDILASTKNSDMPTGLSPNECQPFDEATIPGGMGKNESEISSRKDKHNVSEEFLTPNTKLTAKANFTFK